VRLFRRRPPGEEPPERIESSEPVDSPEAAKPPEPSLSADLPAVDPPAGPAAGSIEEAPEAPAEPIGPSEPADLQHGLERSRGGFMARLRTFLAAPDGPDWDDVEETLIAGDVGPALAMEIVEAARNRRDPAGGEHAVRTELAERLVSRDGTWSLARSGSSDGPAVALVVGVNGTGKTTTIGKLAARERSEGRRVLLAAADTFRAAAIEQLQAWGRRARADVVAHRPDADPGAVVYDALDAAVARGADLVLVDTAGRLHTKTNLMDELAKIRRIVDKRLPGARPETLFVLDATTGQNGLAQAKAFHEAVGLTGVVLTKLDSTAKGGIVFAIEDQLNVPVRFVGVGEGIDDLVPFDPAAFVAALFEAA
jgi:fused signal recognition particle receptor